MEIIISIRVFDSFDPTKEYELFKANYDQAVDLVWTLKKSHDHHRETGLPFSKLNYVAYGFTPVNGIEYKAMEWPRE